MKSKLTAYVIAMGSLAILLSGCGAGGTTPETKNVLNESTHCINCHEETGKRTTPGTDINVVTEWKLSTHMSANGAGCTDCHDDGFLHETTPASCSKCHTVTGQSKNPTKNPDRDGKCAKCHGKVNPRPGQLDGYKQPFTDVDGGVKNSTGTVVTQGTTYTVATGTPLGVPTGSSTRFVHFSTGLRANYVSGNYKNSCRNCHNPHNTAFGREQRKLWAESGHGNSRGLARIGLDAKTRGSRIPLDQNTGNGNFCVRCHTSTGFINFIKDDSFTDINALPDTNGFMTNYPEWTTPRGAVLPQNTQTPPQTYTYTDTSREATNCNVCHLDDRSKSDTSSDSSSYSGKLRKVALTNGVKIYYPFSSAGFKGTTKWVTPVQFEPISNSNLCLTCHSGRATGATIKHPFMLANISSTGKRPSVPSIHDFAGGAVLQGEKSAFLFYTDPLKYTTRPAHRGINTDGNGPCISCHMPKIPSKQTGGTIHSHRFRPVNWTNDDINDSIVEIISYSTVCSSCHTETEADFIKKMNSLRKGFRLSVLILGKIIPSTWKGKNTLVTPNITYTNDLVPALGNLPAAVFTMGASFNQALLLNEPSAYNHSPILARQLIYDSIDWLSNGPANFGKKPDSIYNVIKNTVTPTAAQNVPTGFPVGTYPAGFLWNKKNPISAAILGLTSGPNIVDVNYNTFTTINDREDALEYLCNGYVRGTGQTTCIRW